MGVRGASCHIEVITPVPVMVCIEVELYEPVTRRRTISGREVNVEKRWEAIVRESVWKGIVSGLYEPVNARHEWINKKWEF